MVKDHSDSEKGNPLRQIGYAFRLTARVLLYASSHRQDCTYHCLCYTSRGALAGTGNMLVIRCTAQGDSKQFISASQCICVWVHLKESDFH